MDWLKQIAPTVATALLGPLGGAAIGAIGSILGVSDATQDKITSAIQAGQLTPEQIGKLKELELQYKNEEAERGFKYADLVFKDRDSARGRDVELAKSGRSNFRADVLAYGALISFFVAGWALFKYEMPTTNRELIVYLLGALTVIVKDLYGFEFGSSKGSAENRALLGRFMTGAENLPLNKP